MMECLASAERTFGKDHLELMSPLLNYGNLCRYSEGVWRVPRAAHGLNGL